jgi:hypothetical protein
MRRRWLLLLLSLALASSALAAASSDNGPWLNALTTEFVLLDLTTGDLNGDGRDESIMCYRRDLSRTDQGSGIAILDGKGADAHPVFHVELEGALCEKVRVNGRKLGILLSGNRQVTWTYGAEVRFRGDHSTSVPNKAQVAIKDVTASSSMDAAHAPRMVIDNDLATSWAEAASGTGIGETLTFRFGKPADIAFIAIYAGDGSNQRSFFNKNRLHRGSIEIKTEADLGDAAAGIDFSTLGIDSIGDRIEFTCENRPQVTYVRVGRKDVMELQIRVDSVFLGDKKDDTHISEIEIVPVLDPSQTLDRAIELKPKPTEETEPPKTATSTLPPPPDVDIESATKKLDGDGRSIVPDDF